MTRQVHETLTDPPRTPPVDGFYIVGAGATGAFAGHEGELAFVIGEGQWAFRQPVKGERAWERKIEESQVWTGTGWRGEGLLESGR